MLAPSRCRGCAGRPDGPAGRPRPSAGPPRPSAGPPRPSVRPAGRFVPHTGPAWSDSATTCDYLDGATRDSATIVPDMDSFTPVITLHAIAATYVLLLGPLQILRRRRDLAHRIVGLSWLVAMI